MDREGKGDRILIYASASWKFINKILEVELKLEVIWSLNPPFVAITSYRLVRTAAQHKCMYVSPVLIDHNVWRT